MRRFVLCIVLALAVVGFAGCHKKKVVNPLANVGSKQPDKVLFDRAMDMMKRNKWDQARLVLQTLINTYPDSEYIARAKLAVGDSWYAEGTTTALAQAENEYRDFKTFFPNMVEASEAQMKIANIHYKQMEKADRDYTHAKRAEEEFRDMIQEFPDSPLIPQAKERLREVQEVLAEREFLIGRFYFLRESYMAAAARLQTVVDTYPLFSGADEALYMLGQIDERQADAIRAAKATETQKGELIRLWTNRAAAHYSQIITRYPVADKAGAAKERLNALKRPVPTPTPEAIAQNKAEEAGRETSSRVQAFKDILHRAPAAEMRMASKTGEPALNDPPQTSAPLLVKNNQADVVAAFTNQPLPSETKKDEAEKKPATGDQGTVAPPPTGQGIGELQTLPGADTGGTNKVEAQPAGKGATPGKNEPPPSNPPPSTTTPPPAPAQVNEAAGGQSSTDTAKANSKNDDKESSSSSKKKKKGLKKIIPF